MDKDVTLPVWRPLTTEQQRHGRLIPVYSMMAPRLNDLPPLRRMHPSEGTVIVVEAHRQSSGHHLVKMT